MKEHYDILDSFGSLRIDRWVLLPKDKKEKTQEQFREEFQKEWWPHFVTAFPLLRSGETMQELVEKGELYQRPHAELFAVEVNHSDNPAKLIKFMHAAKLAGLHIEAAVPMDTSEPWYRRILRRQPRETTVSFVVIAPPRFTSPTPIR